MTSDLTSTLYILIIFANLVLASIFIVVKRGRIFNPVLIMNVIWFFSLIFTPVSERGYYPLNDTFLFFVTIAVMSINLSYVAGELLFPAAATLRSLTSVDILTQSNTWFKRTLFLYISYAGLQIYSAFKIYQQYGGITSILGENGFFVRLALVEAGASGGGNIALSILGYILYFGQISIVCGGVLFYFKRKVIYLIPLLISMIISLAYLERNTFVNSLIMFLVPWTVLFAEKSSGINVIKSIRSTIMFLILTPVLLLAIIIPIRIRYPDYGIYDILDSVLSYTIGPFSGFNSYVSNPSLYNNIVEPEKWGLGQNTFWSLISIVNKLGIRIDQQPFHQAYTTISYFGEVTNVYTFMLFPLKDFGVTGLIILSILLGMLCAVFKNRALSGKHEYLVAYAIISTNIIMSFYSLQMRDVRQLVLLVVSLFIMRFPHKRRSMLLSGMRPKVLEAGQWDGVRRL